MKAAIRLLEPETVNIPCFAHTLNLIVKKSLNDLPIISQIREKCRRLVAYFKHSNVANDKLKETQILVNTPSHKLILEVETRWNSTYEMFQRLLEQKQAIILALTSLRFNFELLTDSEWNVLSTIVPILRVFFFITEEISSEKNVNLSKIIPIKRQLLTFLQRSACDLDLEKELRQRLIHYMEFYLGNIENNKYYVISTLLDPRFKTLGFPDNESISRARRLLNDELINYSYNVMPMNETNIIQVVNEQNGRDEYTSFWCSFDNEVNTLNASTSNSSNIITEIENYLMTDYLNRTADPLIFWFTNTVKYPHLSMLVRQYFCIMGTSVPSERVFSKAGNIIDKKRSRLKENIVNQILFLNSYVNNK